MAITTHWYQKTWLSWLLSPVAVFFYCIAGLRRYAYRKTWFKSVRLPVPVIVVGNISVGGTGKTPLVISLARHFQARGYQPGVILRGYKGQATHWPQAISADSDPAQVGDEAVLLASELSCPIVAGPDRIAAGQYLLAGHRCDILISDDGLQHYALARDLEIVVVDGERGLGNGWCLPAGPLRETSARLQSADFIAINAGTWVAPKGLPAARFTMHLKQAVNLLDPARSCELAVFAPREVNAVAAIGHPQRFFNALSAQGFDCLTHAFPDHHAFNRDDFMFDNQLPVFMTSKDAVKCRQFAENNWWSVPVEIDFADTGFLAAVEQKIFPEGISK